MLCIELHCAQIFGWGIKYLTHGLSLILFRQAGSLLWLEFSCSSFSNRLVFVLFKPKVQFKFIGFSLSLVDVLSLRFTSKSMIINILQNT